MSDSFGERDAASNMDHVKRLPLVRRDEPRARAFPSPAYPFISLALMLCALLSRPAASQPLSDSLTRTAAQTGEPDAVAAQPSSFFRDDQYHYAAGARLSAGSGGFDTELGTISEVYARYQWRYGLGVAASYFSLSVGNNESYEPFRTRAITLGPTWHPFKGFWFDPFVAAHLVGLLSISAGSLFYSEEPRRFGVEGIAGLQLASRHVAGGLHARMGTTDRRWGMFGLHLELRL